MKLLAAMLVLLVFGLRLINVAAADQVISRGLALANACAACHGPDGRSQGTIPSISHLPADEFSTALRAFRADARKGTVMNRIAKGLDDTDIGAMAAYFAARRGR
jgi:cytochrome c553